MMFLLSEPKISLIDRNGMAEPMVSNMKGEECVGTLKYLPQQLVRLGGDKTKVSKRIRTEVTKVNKLTSQR